MEQFNLYRRVIKLAICLLLTCTTAFAQQQLVTIDLENGTMGEFLTSIENQTTYKFSYRNKLVDEKKDINISETNVTVLSLLKKVLSKRNLNFTVISEESIVISNKPEQKKVTKSTQTARGLIGIIKDESGMPLIGATITEKGNGQNGTTTGVDGGFSLNLTNDATIIVSYIGFVTKEINTGNKAKVAVILAVDSKILDQVVVVGYGTQKKANLTGAISQVDMTKVLGDRPVTNIVSALQGSIPGLSITGGSSPGGAKTISIRGIASINGGTPLVLIDNVPGDLDMINPEDIQSVTTLKDAASAAIYGARGAFGVILITTKKAKKNTPLSVSYNTSIGFQVPDNKLEQPDMLTILGTLQDWDNNNEYYADGQDYDKWMQYVKEHRAGTLGANNPNAEYYQNGRFIPEGGDAYYYLEATNPQSAIFDDYGFQQTHNLSATGGSENITYRMSLGYTDQDGPLKMDKDTYDRITIGSYVNADINKWLSTSIDVRYAKSNQNSMEIGNVWSNVHLPIWYPSGDMVSSKDLTGDSYPVNSPYNYLKYGDAKKYTTDNPRIFSRTVFTPLEGLEAVLEYTYDKKNTSSSYNIGEKNLMDDQMALKPMNTFPSYTITNSQVAYNSLNAYATYSKTLKEKHNTKFMLGYNQDTRDSETLWTSRRDIINPNMPSIAGATGVISASDGYGQYSIRSGFFRFNYDYDGKYMVEMNARYDGSSKFPTDSRFGIFPSLSVGWNIAKEDFMSGTSGWLGELKLRGSWGQLGNQSISPYAYYPEMKAINIDWVIDGVQAVSLGMPGLVSGNFTWEKVETTDIGLDFNVLNNQLTGSFDWYQRDTKGMLAPGSQIPATAGTDAPQQNVADLRTKGWEFAIQWRQTMKDWRYGIGFNIFDSRTHITKYDNKSGTLSTTKTTTYREGQELGEIWGAVSDGFYTINDFDAAALANGQWTLKDGVPAIQNLAGKIRPGDVKFKDLNVFNGKENLIDSGDGTATNPGDRKIIGNNTARYNFGMNANVGWKGFDLSFMLQGTGKRDFWFTGGATQNSIRFPMAYKFGTVYSHQLDYWKPISTDPASPDYYKPINANPEFGRIYGENANGPSNNRVQDQYLLDASYIRLKNVTFSYTIPKDFIKKVGLKGAKVFFSGENLLTITSLPDGMDPERLSWGYPFFATYSFGINLTL